MDTELNKFIELEEESKKIGRIKVDENILNGRYIEFSIGQAVAINGYWFGIKGVQNENELILRPIGMTEGYKKKMNKRKEHIL